MINHTETSCERFRKDLFEYCAGRKEANYPVPALVTTFDYWPATDTDDCRPCWYGMDHYKPGRWRQFMHVKGPVDGAALCDALVYDTPPCFCCMEHLPCLVDLLKQ